MNKERVNVSMKSGGSNSNGLAAQKDDRSNSRKQLQVNYYESYPINVRDKIISGMGGEEISNLVNGLEEEELIGLDLVDRNRQ